ncbi:NUDIX domain-containing protein [Candidatus Parcubacteria bacterium]|nr:NUDIX domain-containing protein [Candidatus Parcubacteria bacterium]
MEIKDKEMHRVTITCVVYKHGKYLITRRSLEKKFLPGIWHVPGGGLTVDDYINLPKAGQDQTYGVLALGLRREIEEEVNLEIGTPEYFNDCAFIKPDGTPVINICFFAPYVSGEVKLDPDTIDYKWVTLSELKDFDLIKGLEDEIKMVDDILKERKIG